MKLELSHRIFSVIAGRDPAIYRRNQIAGSSPAMTKKTEALVSLVRSIATPRVTCPRAGAAIPRRVRNFREIAASLRSSQ
jgi:hypothetical protein